jgi:hypothetical protein
MEDFTICPYCGHAALSVKEVEIQEIDSDLLQIRPPEKLTEMECQDCGWFGAKPTGVH